MSVLYEVGDKNDCRVHTAECTGHLPASQQLARRRRRYFNVNVARAETSQLTAEAGNYNLYIICVEFSRLFWLNKQSRNTLKAATGGIVNNINHYQPTHSATAVWQRRGTYC